MIRDDHQHVRNGLILIFGVLLVRIIGLFLTPLNLGGDEAQYWLWAQNLDWGYASKPPLLAWSIWLTTTLAQSDAEAWVRLSSPFFHTGTALVLLFMGRQFWSARTGFWAAITFLLMPGVQLSSGLISTDPPLLMFWSVGLWAYLNFRQNRSLQSAVLMGAALGMAMLAKYAAIYFIIGIIIDCVLHSRVRRNVLSLHGLSALAAFLIIISPNIFWNLNNGLATISHTADNANWGNSQMFNPSEALEFFGAQFGVFGPIAFGLLLWGVLTRARGDTSAALKGFIWPIVIIVTIQAFLSRAHANWAGVAYVAGSLLVAVTLTHLRTSSWLKSSAVIHALVGGVFYACALSLPLADAMGVGTSFKRVRAWPQTTQAIVNLHSQHGPFDRVVVDNRMMFNDLAYYGRDTNIAPLRMWLLDAPHNHAERTAPLEQNDNLRVLFIRSRSDHLETQRNDFAEFEQLDTISIDTAPGKSRNFHAFAASGHNRQPR